MTRSSRTRRLRARAKKRAAKHAVNPNASDTSGTESSLPELSDTDRRYLIGFALLSLLITAVYFWLGGRNLFVFPALFCISVGARKYWTGPMRRYADNP